ncbi:MAG: 30S ribosomal protein S9 [Patescibacteria group bacterium]
MSTNLKKYTEGVGRRKEAVARVRITPKTGASEWLINERTPEEYFSVTDLKRVIKEPLTVLDKEPKLTVSVLVKGGGIKSQAEAISLGLARALLKAELVDKPALKEKKLLTRDGRVKERKKFGLKKARKSPQWSKR